MTRAYQVETFDATNNKTTRRKITPLPTPTRLQPPKPITKPELIEMIDALRDDVATEQKRFDNKDAMDNANAAKRQELFATIADLTQQLNAAQAELDQLERAGSVRDGFIEFAQRAEQRITQIATGVYGYLLEKFSQDRHEAPFAELTPLLKEDVRFKVDRSGVRTFTLPGFARFHAVPKDQITNARIESTLEKVYSATQKLEAVSDK
jgi:DNA repair exonuclease SbcCD ATPase subunit